MYQKHAILKRSKFLPLQVHKILLCQCGSVHTAHAQARKCAHVINYKQYLKYEQTVNVARKKNSISSWKAYKHTTNHSKRHAIRELYSNFMEEYKYRKYVGKILFELVISI